MSKLFLLCAALCAVLTPDLALARTAAAPSHLSSADGAEGTTVFVPAGTPIPVRVIGSISSSYMKDGDTFQVQAAQDVVVHGMVVVRAGSLGSASVGQVDHAGGNGHSGALTINFDWIYAVDGGKVRLAQAYQKQSEQDLKGASSTATFIGLATFGVYGLFGHNLVHGHDMTIDGNKVMSAFVANSIHVTATDAVRDEFDH